MVMSVAIRSYARLLKDARVKWLVRKILGHLYAEQGRIPKNQSCPSMRGRRIRRSVKDGRRKQAQGKMLGGRISSLATLGACLNVIHQTTGFTQLSDAHPTTHIFCILQCS
jgi:hypothetical protein